MILLCVATEYPRRVHKRVKSRRVPIFDARYSLDIEVPHPQPSWFEIKYNDVHYKDHRVWMFFSGGALMKFLSYDKEPIPEIEELKGWIGASDWRPEFDLICEGRE